MAGPARNIPLREVAEAAGVSISAASRALSGAAGVSDALRARVRAVADRLALALPDGAAPQIAVLTPIAVGAGGSPDFQQELLAGIRDAAEDLGVSLQIHLLGAGGGTLPAADGILCLSTESPDLIAAIQTAGRPAVLVNSVDPLFRLDRVGAANHAGGYAGARHLIGLGHTRILRLGHARRLPVRDRLGGSDAALAEAGLTGQTLDLPEMRADIAYDLLRARLNGPRDFTAIQCCNDAAALGALTAAREAGLDVPGEISIIGFDDLPAAALSAPALTTLRVPRVEIGRASLRRLLERIAAPEAAVTAQDFACALIARGSTGPA